MRVLARDGYAGATVAAVAREAGLAQGLVHYHFASKSELLAAAIAQLSERLAQRVEQGALRDGRAASPRADLHALLAAHVGLGPGADAAAVGAWVAIGAEAMRSPEVREVYERELAAQITRVRGLVRRALTGEGRPPRRAATITLAIVASIEGMYRIGVGAPAAIIAGSGAATVRRLVDALLDAEPTSASPARRSAPEEAGPR